MNIRCLLIDDEPPALKVLASHISNINSLEIVGQCKNALEALNDNCFFVVMTGDSRDKNGAYYGCEAEHEIFFKEQGLHIYNKIVYLECEFTRLATAKDM